MGTDGEGRDILSRVIIGTRISLELTAAAIVISVAIGTSLGVVAGYFGGWVDALVMRSVDAMLSLPTILLALMFALTLGPRYWTVVLVLVLVLWARYARLMRGVAKTVRERDSSPMRGSRDAPTTWIMQRHILPHIVDTILVFSTLQIGLTILMEASLSFLGAGVPPPTPTLGQMVQDGRSVLELAWWVSVVPGVVIMLLVVVFNNFGDWLRDTLDPEAAAALIPGAQMTPPSFGVLNPLQHADAAVVDTAQDRPILEVRDLETYLFTKRGVGKAVDGVSFSLRRGETLGLVGESGSGKSLTALSIVGLNPKPASRVVGGHVFFRGEDLLGKTERDIRRYRGRHIAMILQDPLTALNPALSIRSQLYEALRLHKGLSGAELRSLAKGAFL